MNNPGPTGNIAGVTVFYNPCPEYVENILAYRDSVAVVYVVDNSEHPDTEIAERLAAVANVIYLRNNRNLGIAEALNMAAERALAAGYDYLLTMDQDSVVTPGMVEALLACLDRAGREEVGIVTPRHQHGATIAPVVGECCDVDVAMTSGNLLNLKAYQRAGAFRNDYFIDYVDHEYCLRLRLHGYRIIQANHAILRHQLGAMTWHRLLHRRIKVCNHPPIRRYYGFRNRFYFYRQYGKLFPGSFRHFYRDLFLELVTLFLFEQRPLAKLRMMLRGYLDYRRGVSGRYEGRP